MLKEELKEREQKLTQLIREKETALKHAPEGTLRANRHGKGIQYYHCKSSENYNGVYIKQSQQWLAKELAQKEYDQKVLRGAKKEIILLKRLNKLYQKEKIEDILDKMATSKQQLVNPIRMSDEMYIKKWESENYNCLKFQEGTMEYYSDKGERMRSKSEIIIANALYKRNIPYKYECPLSLNGYGMVYPDFTVLNVRERKEMYWEHFGLMDDHDYREKNFGKIAWYETNNYFPGDKLIMTFETAKQALNTRLIEIIIEKYLL